MNNSPNFQKNTILFGGSFDPPHLGHLHIATESAKTVKDAQLVFVPCCQSPGKKALLASAEMRWDFLQLALKNTSFLAWREELDRAGDSYTIDTLKKAHSLGAKKERLFWLLGADAYQNLSHWHHAQDLRSFCQLLVVGRANLPLEKQNPEDHLVSIPLHDASSTAIRQSLAQGIVPPNALPRALEAHLQKILQSQNPYVIQKV